jgi:hypothetical protein
LEGVFLSADDGVDALPPLTEDAGEPDAGEAAPLSAGDPFAGVLARDDFFFEGVAATGVSGRISSGATAALGGGGGGVVFFLRSSFFRATNSAAPRAAPTRTDFIVRGGVRDLCVRSRRADAFYLNDCRFFSSALVLALVPRSEPSPKQELLSG